MAAQFPAIFEKEASDRNNDYSDQSIHLFPEKEYSNLRKSRIEESLQFCIWKWRLEPKNWKFLFE